MLFRSDGVHADLEVRREKCPVTECFVVPITQVWWWWADVAIAINDLAWDAVADPSQRIVPAVRDTNVAGFTLVYVFDGHRVPSEVFRCDWVKGDR